MAKYDMTYKQLDDVLMHLGFSRQIVKDKWLRYDHSDSETTIILIEKKPTDPVRETDAWSAREHLIWNGFVTEKELDELFADVAKKKVTARNK